MVDPELEDILSSCIDQIASGQNVESCLCGYPRHASMLRPLLEVGAKVNALSYDPLEVAQSKERVRARIAGTRRLTGRRQI